MNYNISILFRMIFKMLTVAHSELGLECGALCSSPYRHAAPIELKEINLSRHRRNVLFKQLIQSLKCAPMGCTVP